MSNATAVLALGIGVNLAFFAVLQANLTRRPPHVRAPGNLYELTFDEASFDGSTIQQAKASYPLFERVRDLLRGRAGVACYHSGPVGVGRGRSSREVRATVVSPGYFQLLGVEPIRGRRFSPDEQVWNRGGVPVAIVDSRFWEEVFGGVPVDDIGLVVADHSLPVVGILPEGFRGVSRSPSEVWLPLESSVDLVDPFDRRALDIISDARTKLFRILVRPAKGQALEGLRSILRVSLIGSDVGSEVLDIHLEVDNSAQLTPFSRQLLRWGGLMALLTLLVAGANVATLALLKGLRCADRMTVQHQLGATRGEILRQTLTESVILVALATLVAAGLFVLIAAVLANSLRLPPLSLLQLSGLQSWGYLALILFVVLAVIAIPTGVQAIRLAAPAAGSPSLRRAGRAKSSLVFSQITLTTILLAQAGLFYASIREAIDDLGYAPGNLVMVEVPNLRKLGHSDASVEAIFDRLEARARLLPGAVSTARSTSGPDRNSLVTGVRGPDGKLPSPPEGTYLSGISPGYIATMGMRLLAGRDFLPTDSAESERVVILNEALARRLWKGGDPIGGCVYVGRAAECSRVVGVLSDSRIDATVFADPRLHCYLPLKQYAKARIGRPGDYLFVRVAEGEVNSTIDRLKAAPDLPSYVFTSHLGELVGREISSMMAGLRILGMLALAAVAVSAAGVFAQLSSWVDSRRKELGIRLALGAGSAQIVRAVVGAGATPVALGVVFGLAASDPVSDLARGYIFGLSPLPPSLMVGIVLIVLTAAGLAWLPACLRAVGIDPLEVLRTE